MNEKEKDSFPYADIIDLSHHVSTRHPPMPMLKRAAQFAPFAAVGGALEMYKEMVRHVEQKKMMTEDEKSILDAKLQLLWNSIDQNPYITVTYFEPDKKKEGGTYVTVEGVAKRIDQINKVLFLGDDIQISILEISNIGGLLFSGYGF